MKILKLLIVIVSVFFIKDMYAIEKFISFDGKENYFPLVTNNEKITIATFPDDHKGVIMAVENLKDDLFRVTGNQAMLSDTYSNDAKIIVGSLDKSKFIQALVKSGQIKEAELKGKKEKYIITLVKDPFGKGGEVLVIAGSDKRGTIYGIYELSSQIGVSPWYWWADVPVVKRENLYVKNGVYTDGEPAVEYRGIFINDEWPAYGGWTKAKFGGFNSKMYKHVFELILRLKGNFLWPAMWSAAFYYDDPENGRLADDMGIVIGTSHHEPMGKPHQEWRKTKADYGNAEWDYTTNKQGLNKFFKDGIERLRNWESIVTLGMRGDGDKPMGEDQNIGLMEEIIKEQRKIISEATGKKAEVTPQVWALYKEVQDYYDKGMRVPDDVILLLCDDNWGNVRKLPNEKAREHKGGYGMYYHFDYVGGPRSYKWLNVSQIQRVWEQMSLTYEHGVDKIWIVNVGDIKPMEFPITFWFDMAWDPKRFNATNLMSYTEEFCKSQFGEKEAKEAASILNKYCKYNYRVTPELLDTETYSLDFNEFLIVSSEYKSLEADALNQYLRMPTEYKDAYFQLVLFPVQAMANLYEMYYSAAMNKKLAGENDIRANMYADKVKDCFNRDARLCSYYNNELSGGKWKHMMDQKHIGYTTWNEPKEQKAPEVTYVDPAKTKQGGYTFQKQEYIVSIEAEHFYSSKDNGTAKWTIIPDFGKTLSGLTLLPSNVSVEGCELTYKVKLDPSDNDVRVTMYLASTLPFNDNKGLRYAISIDDEKERVVNFNQDMSDGNFERWQANRIITWNTRLRFKETSDGIHTIKIRPLEGGIVFQKMVINCKQKIDRKTYLGVPETKYTRE